MESSISTLQFIELTVTLPVTVKLLTRAAKPKPTTVKNNANATAIKILFVFICFLIFYNFFKPLRSHMMYLIVTLLSIIFGLFIIKEIDRIYFDKLLFINSLYKFLVIHNFSPQKKPSLHLVFNLLVIIVCMSFIIKLVVFCKY